MLGKCWAAVSHWNLLKWLECRKNIKYEPERCFSMDRFSTGDSWNLLCLKAQISVAYVGVHDKNNEGHVMGTRADHADIGNKLQPAVNPQVSSECDKNWSDVCEYWKYLIIDASQGNWSCLAWTGTLAWFIDKYQAGPTAQIRVWNVHRDRKMQKEAMSGPEGERKEPACSWSLANIQKQEDAKA